MEGVPKLLLREWGDLPPEQIEKRAFELVASYVRDGSVTPIQAAAVVCMIHSSPHDSPEIYWDWYRRARGKDPNDAAIQERIMADVRTAPKPDGLSSDDAPPTEAPAQP